MSSKIKKEITRLICEEILATGLNSLANTSLEKIYVYYSPEIVLAYLREEKDKLYKIINSKYFPTLTDKIRYFIGVLRNCLAQYTYMSEKNVYGTHEDIFELNPNDNHKQTRSCKMTLKEIENEYIQKVEKS